MDSHRHYPVTDVADLVSQIANASGEQAIGVDEINKALAKWMK
jgi:methyl-accepting chemotaxis protein